MIGDFREDIGSHGSDTGLEALREVWHPSESGRWGGYETWAVCTGGGLVGADRTLQEPCQAHASQEE